MAGWEHGGMGGQRERVKGAYRVRVRYGWIGGWKEK